MIRLIAPDNVCVFVAKFKGETVGLGVDSKISDFRALYPETEVDTWEQLTEEVNETEAQK